MARLIVRNLDEKVVLALKRRAVSRGVSVEDEHRRLLEAALLRPSFKDYLEAMPELGPPMRKTRSRRGRGRRGNHSA